MYPQNNVTIPSLFSYPCIIAFVTASETAVLISVMSETVGFNCDTNVAATTLANASFSDFAAMLLLCFDIVV